MQKSIQLEFHVGMIFFIIIMKFHIKMKKIEY